MNGLLEVGADVRHVTVLHWDPLVVVVAPGRLQVPTGHIEQGADVKIAEIVFPGGMVGTAQVKERQDLYRFTLQEDEYFYHQHLDPVNSLERGTSFVPKAIMVSGLEELVCILTMGTT